MVFRCDDSEWGLGAYKSFAPHSGARVNSINVCRAFLYIFLPEAFNSPARPAEGDDRWGVWCALTGVG